MMRSFLKIIVTALALAPSLAFAQNAPYVHGSAVGTSPVQALPNNPARRKIFLYNPNATAALAFCPAGPNRDTGAAVACVVNGAGSITLQPYFGLVLEGSLPSGQPLYMSSSWNVVSSAGGSTFTVLEFE